MSGAQIELDVSFAAERFARLERTVADSLLDAIGELVVGQIKERIDTDKRSPEGVAWPAWSDVYAATRKGSQSLLLGEGNLQGSIAAVRRGDAVAVGSGSEYAAIHQFGGDTSRGHPPIPARPYLGLSPEDRRAIDELISDAIMEALK